MPELRRRKPCPGCPWLRDSLQGYLGEDSAVPFLRKTVLGEGEMPCHQSIDYSDPDWKETQLPEADLCAGGLMFLANSCHSPRRAWLNTAVRIVGRGTARVFTWPWEFLEYHGRMDPATARKQAAAAYLPGPGAE